LVFDELQRFFRTLRCTESKRETPATIGHVGACTGLKYSLHATAIRCSPNLNTLDRTWIFAQLALTSLYDFEIKQNKQKFVSWGSFNAQIDNTRQQKAHVGHCAMLNHKSTVPSTVYIVRKQLNAMMNILDQKYSVITFDWASTI
jgi:hypothetical protein